MEPFGSWMYNVAEQPDPSSQSSGIHLASVTALTSGKPLPQIQMEIFSHLLSDGVHVSVSELYQTNLALKM